MIFRAKFSSSSSYAYMIFETENARRINIVRIYIDHMKCAAYMAFSFITFLHILLLSFFYIILYMVVCFLCFC